MILYVDSSAIVKRYVLEDGSSEMENVIGEAEAVGTTLISRAEVVAVFSKAVRMRVIGEKEAKVALRAFNQNWRDLVRTRVTEKVVQDARRACPESCASRLRCAAGGLGGRMAAGARAECYSRNVRCPA